MEMFNVQTLEELGKVTKPLKLTLGQQETMKERVLEVLCSLIQRNDPCFSGTIRDKVNLAFLYVKDLDQTFSDFVECEP